MAEPPSGCHHSSDVQEFPAPEQDGSRRIGRGVFLATVAGGLSSLYWGKAAWGHVSHALHGVGEVLGPGSGWRIYTVAATMPTFDPAAWTLRVGGLVEHPLELSYDDLRRLPQASQVTDFHCVTGWTVTACAGEESASRIFSRGRGRIRRRTRSSSSRPSSRTSTTSRSARRASAT